jgi:hypothetical protein
MRIFNDLKNDFKGSTLPFECERYLFFVKQYLEGYRFDSEMIDTAIYSLKNEYDYYHKFKNHSNFNDFKGKYDLYTFLRDFMANCKNETCANALAALLLYFILENRRNEYICSFAYKSFKKSIIEEIKNIDRVNVPESFFCHYHAEDITQKDFDLRQKYLDLMEENLELRQKIADYEYDEDFDDDTD